MNEELRPARFQRYPTLKIKKGVFIWTVPPPPNPFDVKWQLLGFGVAFLIEVRNGQPYLAYVTRLPVFGEVVRRCEWEPPLTQRQEAVLDEILRQEVGHSRDITWDGWRPIKPWVLDRIKRLVGKRRMAVFKALVGA